jgi:hypothetical protein
MLNNGFNNLWPTSVYVGSIDEKINDEVCESIFLNLDLTKPYSEFQDFDLLYSGPDILQKFRDNVVWPAFDSYLAHHNINLSEMPNKRLRSWLTGTYDGYMIPVHNHSGATLSAIFYFLCTDSDKGGELVLMDSRANANRGYVDSFKPWFQNKIYSPKTSEYIIFPGHVYHHTIPFRGHLRLAMPVDLFL